MEPVKPKKGRPPKGTPLATDGKSVKVLPDVDVQLGKAAKKLKMSKSDFASAAIAYFAETGLDPRKISKASLAKVEQRVVQETYDVREHNANIGNRLVGIIRTFERNMSLMIQQQQAGTFKYLEGIERNILSYLVNVEEHLLTTILERVMLNNVESHMSRVMLQVLGLQLDEKRFPFSEAEVKKLTADYDQQRDTQRVNETQKLVESKKVARPRLTTSPSFVEIPKAPTATKPTGGATTTTSPAPAGTTATPGAAATSK